MAGDPLTNAAALGAHVRNWHATLRHGLEASELGPERDAVAEVSEARLRTGRPLAAEASIADQEAALKKRGHDTNFC